MSYRYLGYGITDSNGEAKLEYDENGNHLDHSITGTGAGELDIVASLDNPIGSGSLVSEIYEVWDYIVYDNGTSSDHKDIWDISKCTLDRGEEYSEITESEEYGFIRTKQANAIPKDCIMEFDYMNVDGAIGNNMFGIYSSANQYITVINFLYLGNLSIGAWHHIKIKIENGLMTVTNTTNSTVYTLNLTIPTEKILFLFMTTNQTTKARFKNFKAYPV